MKLMKLKTVVMVLAILTMFSAPSWAGSVAAYGSYWNSKDADNSWGAGVDFGFNFVKHMELEIHGTYYSGFQNDDFAGTSTSIDLTVIPVDAGLKFDFLPDKTVNPFVGGGVSYYFLSTTPGSVDDQTGVYLNAGIDAGGKTGARFFAEVMWRKVDTSVSFGSFEQDVNFDGLSMNAGVVWRWGK